MATKRSFSDQRIGMCLVEVQKANQTAIYQTVSHEKTNPIH